MVTDSCSILAGGRSHFSQVLNVLWVNDFKQTEIHTTEPLVSEASAFEIEMAIERIKRHKSSGTDQIPKELIKTRGRKIRFQIHKYIYSNWSKEEVMRKGRSRSLYLFIRRAIKEIVVIIEAYQFCYLRTKFYPTSCCQG